MARQHTYQTQRYQNINFPFENRAPGNMFAQDHLRSFFPWESFPVLVIEAPTSYCTNGSSSPGTAQKISLTWHCHSDTGFSGMKNARIRGSWKLPSRFQRSLWWQDERCMFVAPIRNPPMMMLELLSVNWSFIKDSRKLDLPECRISTEQNCKWWAERVYEVTRVTKVLCARRSWQQGCPSI